MKRGGIKEANISLIIDSYDEIFSTFDPRGYSERSLSQDFLDECIRASRDKGEKIEFRILVPKSRRNLSEEAMIRRRLKEHFFKHFLEKEKEVYRIRHQGFRWFIVGTALMTIATFLDQYNSFGLHFLVTMAEPAGWFSFWEGLYKILVDSNEKVPNFLFYKKMSTAFISFVGY